MTDWVVRPKDFFRYLGRLYGVPPSEMRIPRRALLVFGGRDWAPLKRAIRGRSPPWHRGLAIGRAGKQPLALLYATIGSPSAVIAVEEAAALGAREILAFGSCGSLAKDLPIGSVVVPVRAYSEEGASRHYAGARWSRPDPALARALKDACRRRGLAYREGGVWTTDAPYRESRAKARALSRLGVVAVDMEASAIYTAARSLGVCAASLFVVSDELAGGAWVPGFRHPDFRSSRRRARRVTLDLMADRFG